MMQLKPVGRGRIEQAYDYAACNASERSQVRRAAASQHADEQRHERRHHADRQRHARAIDGARENVAPEMVRAEPERGRRARPLD